MFDPSYFDDVDDEHEEQDKKPERKTDAADRSAVPTKSGDLRAASEGGLHAPAAPKQRKDAQLDVVDVALTTQPLGPKLDPAKSSLLRVLAGGFYEDAMAVSALAPILPFYARRFHLSQQTITLFLAIRSSTSLVSALPVSLLFRLVPYGAVLGGGLLLAATASFILAFPPTWEVLPIALLLQGICFQLIRSTGMVFAANLVEPDSSPDSEACTKLSTSKLPGPVADVKPGSIAVGIPQDGDGMIKASSGHEALFDAIGFLYGWLSMGTVLGPLLGNVLYQHVAKWLPYSIVASIALTVAACLAVVQYQSRGKGGKAKLSPKVKGNPHSGKLKYEKLEDAKEVTEGGTAVHPGKPNKNLNKTMLVAIQLILQDRVAFTVLAMIFFETMSWGFMEVTSAFFLADQCDLQETQIGIAYAVDGLSYALTAWQSSLIIGVLGPTLTLTLGLVLTGVSFPLLVLSTTSCNMYFQCLVMFANGVGYACIEFPAFPTVVSALEHDFGFSDIPHVVGLFNTVYIAGYMFGPLLAAAFDLHLTTLGGMSAVGGILLGLAPVVLVGASGATA